ncbi:MAG: hypothetical protein Faunusvirus9_3 [Faunusvirus sp.]|jgi:hypothetical protein|uniref:Uncharacterized protein n=1 Tax=Faunusvirus sp. TaxID=2487766 RepID=A0A3G4ZWR3_9VIRU|nr:MAG: hypothetical protein Faunusvirus9_3 [Faunusvirus sp.]
MGVVASNINWLICTTKSSNKVTPVTTPINTVVKFHHELSETEIKNIETKSADKKLVLSADKKSVFDAECTDDVVIIEPANKSIISYKSDVLNCKKDDIYPASGVVILHKSKIPDDKLLKPPIDTANIIKMPLPKHPIISTDIDESLPILYIYGNNKGRIPTIGWIFPCHHCGHKTSEYNRFKLTDALVDVYCCYDCTKHPKYDANKLMTTIVDHKTVKALQTAVVSWKLHWILRS